MQARRAEIKDRRTPHAGPCSSDTTKSPTPRMEPAGVGFVVDSDDGSATFAEDDAEDDADIVGWSGSCVYMCE